MDKAHDVQSASVSGTKLMLEVDGVQYDVDIAAQSKTLAAATQAQRDNFEVSPSGYGIHWPDLDEDLSIDGLIGTVHKSPVRQSAAEA